MSDPLGILGSTPLQLGGSLTNPCTEASSEESAAPCEPLAGHILKVVAMRTNDDSAPPQSSVVGKIVLIHVGMSLRQAEELLIGATLQQTGGNVREAAKILGIDRSTLHEKIKLYGIVEWTREWRKGVGKPPKER